MKFKAIIFLTFFSVFLFTPTFVMLVDNDTKICFFIYEIEEEEKTETKLAEKEIEFLNFFEFNHLSQTNVYHNFLNKGIFNCIRHYIDEDVPPPERLYV